MKSLSRILSAAGLALGLALTAVPAEAQQKNAPAPAAAPLKPASPAAIAAAKEILTMKNASAMYANAVPNLVEQTKNVLMQSNLNYQKDLNEVAIIVAKNLAGREKEIGDGMAQVYANEFTEQELKDLVDVLQVAARPEAARERAPRHPVQHVLYEPVGAGFAEIINGQFRAEMKKRGKDI